MTLEVKSAEVVAEQNTTIESAPVVETNLDPYEEKAREQGWVPREEYKGDPNTWRGSKEFVERGELFGKIDSLGKELKETKKALKMLQEHNEKIKESEYKRAVDELKKQQKEHLENGNSDGYLHTTELLTDLRAEQKAREVLEKNKQPEQTEQHPDFVSWVEKNSSYNADSEMKQFADILGTGYAQANPDLPPNKVLDYVTAQVKSRFKDKFENPNRNKPSAVEGSATTGKTRSSTFELTDEERKVMNTFVRTGLMSKEDYIAQVKQMRG